MKLPAQDSAAAKLLRDISESGSLYPLQSELVAALKAADELATLGWKIGAEFSPSRHCRGPRNPDAGLVGLSIDNNAFLDWCDSAEAQTWLAAVPKEN